MFRMLVMSFQESEEGGKVLGVDLKAESRRIIEWDVCKKSVVSVSWVDTVEKKRRREPLAWP